MTQPDTNVDAERPDQVADQIADAAATEGTADGSDAYVNLAALEARVDEFREQYRSATPFAHIVIDDVLPAEVLERVYAELDAMNADDWNSYIHFNERKFSNTDSASWGPTLRAVSDVFAGDRFRRFLEAVSGFDDLHADVTLDGGGVHRCYRGGFLNIHSDFTAHHTIQSWRRRVNLLLYLNPVWEPAWGGDLELWDRDMRRCEAQVAPIGNRILLFSTDEHSYHGHPDPLQAPDGVARQSLALYYFTREDKPLAKATDYRPRPDDGAKKFMIFADKKALAAYDVIKRRFHVSDDAVRSVMAKFSRRPK
ncbi:MAG TPA: 2OG-Fe(II) oxygenase [Ilumatobacteraceae bacterium]|nr:2OG-Fe(II) oxygenase [Ilumatobacteraceae bacterium]